MDAQEIITLINRLQSVKLRQGSREQTHCTICGKPLNDESIRGTWDCLCSGKCYEIYETLKDRIDSLDIIPPFYRKLDLSRINQPIEKLNSVLSWDYKRAGLILFGQTGCNKTFFATQLIMKLILLDGFYGSRIKVYMAGQFERELLSCFGNKAKMNIDDFIYKVSNVPVLMIDDLGKEGNGERNSGRFETSIFQIIENRIANQKTTIITTNYVGETLSNRFNDKDTWRAIYRRFKDYYDTISFYRQK